MAMSSSENVSGLADGDAFRVFWTAFDPLDLASGSIDPMGLLRGYLVLVDRLLPGLTTVTGVPRYASMICAAASVAAAKIPARDDLRGAKLRQKRLVLMKAYERAWALACGLAARDEKIGPAALEGVRGVRSVNRRLDARTPNTKYIKSSSFNLLSNQVRYGGIGIYSAFLDSCHLLTSEDLSLRPAGERLAAAFPAPPPGVAVDDEEAPLSIDALTAWGAEAHPGELTRSEARWLAEGLEGGGESDWDDEVRWSMLRLLAAHATAESPPSEAEVLKAVLASLASGGGVATQVPRKCADQIRAVLMVVEPYERLYQSVLFLFQAIQAAATEESEVSFAQIGGADSITAAVAASAKASRDLPAALKRAAEIHGESIGSIGDALRGSGVTGLAEQLVLAASPESVLDIVLARHEAVQSGKLDDGVRKASWLKRLPSRKVCLAAQRFRLGVSARPMKWSEVGRHPYRTSAAFEFIRACGDRIP
jgi:hypothetical protein